MRKLIEVPPAEEKQLEAFVREDPAVAHCVLPVLRLRKRALGSLESRAAARLMAGPRCETHIFRTAAEVEAAHALHNSGRVVCRQPNTPFILSDIERPNRV